MEKYIYKDMIKTEDSSCCYDMWERYRNSLTAYIAETLEIDGFSCKPMLAIWGAGGCNDIDISTLKNDFKLVLVDYETEYCEKALERFDLTRTDAVCADYRFWPVEHEDCMLLEEMLCDGTECNQIIEFLDDVLNEYTAVTYPVNEKHFDFSVAVGLSSQLNSRMAALVDYYSINYSREEIDNILRKLSVLNKAAVEKMFSMIYNFTDQLIIFGYEENVVYSDGRETVSISGNDYLRELINMKEQAGEIRRLQGDTILTWPFSDEKKYDMRMVAIKKTL